MIIIIIIIIVKLYSAYILKKFILIGAKKNHLTSHTRGQTKVVAGAHNRQKYLWRKSNFKQICFQVFFYERCLNSFRRFNRKRDLIPNCWHTYRKTTFASI